MNITKLINTLPDCIIDNIYFMVHNNYMIDICKEIDSRKSFISIYKHILLTIDPIFSFNSVILNKENIQLISNSEIKEILFEMLDSNLKPLFICNT